jgi:hypothetical protein
MDIDLKWQIRFNDLKKFIKEYGLTEFMYGTRNQHESLSNWCYKQRQLYKFRRKNFDPDRIRQLNEIGFNWIPYDNWWENNLKELKKHIKKHGHFFINSDSILGHWTNGVRSRYRAGKLSAERVEILNALEFPWDSPVLTEREIEWERFYAELNEFKKIYGHCDVPEGAKYKKLRRWCILQRRRGETGDLVIDPKYLNRLNAIGFSWEGSQDKVFQYNFSKLKEYKEKHGHCLVNIDEDRELASWSRRLRNRKTWLPSEYKARLNSIEFEWNTPKGYFMSLKHNSQWKKKFIELVEFKKKYGHCNLRAGKEHAVYSSLYYWALAQKGHYYKKNKNLTLERIEKLNSIGFDWTLGTAKINKKRNDAYWEKQFNKMIEYKHKYGHCNVRHRAVDKEYELLYRWAVRQRNFYAEKNENLIPEKINKLNNIGFLWSHENNGIKDKILLDELKRLNVLLGKPPTHREIEKFGNYNVFKYKKHFGSLTIAFQLAGLE